MTSYYKDLIRDILIGMICAVAVVCTIFGAALQEQDKLSEMAVMEVGE